MLRAASGQNVPFTKAAAYRNMTFQPLSDYAGPAEISVKGLQPLFGNDDPRDVYLYVHTANMAPHGNEPLWLATDAMAATRRFAEVPLPLPRAPKRPREPAGAANQPRLREMPLPSTGIRDLDLNAMQALRAVWPTYDVHVYYDTGKVIKIGKVDTKQLAPMYPFTYFYSHEGALFGFTHKLEGDAGTVVKEIRANKYLIQVPSEGVAKITTSAVAHEQRKDKEEEKVCPECPQQPPPQRGICDCAVPGAPRGRSVAGWAALAASIVAFGLRARRRRRG